MNRPRASKEIVQKLALEAWRKDGHTSPLPKVYNLAVRGYRAESMGKTEDNECGIFDDAFFLVTPDSFHPENANTDPSKLGWNPGVGKPYGMLKTGVWHFYPGPHKGRRPAFRQADDAEVAKKLGIPHSGKFHVTRMWGWDDSRNYDEWGHQQVNIHFGKGPITGTSSWLCLTVPEGSDWLQIATDALKRYHQALLPVILINGPIV